MASEHEHLQSRLDLHGAVQGEAGELTIREHTRSHHVHDQSCCPAALEGDRSHGADPEMETPVFDTARRGKEALFLEESKGGCALEAVGEVGLAGHCARERACVYKMCKLVSNTPRQGAEQAGHAIAVPRAQETLRTERRRVPVDTGQGRLAGASILVGARLVRCEVCIEQGGEPPGSAEGPHPYVRRDALARTGRWEDAVPPPRRHVEHAPAAERVPLGVSEVRGRAARDLLRA
mmetsp:Transcript_1831/g.5151  ORF Transcript_1831/g.5151 Transcript_1831/m.5151 type:complete len:235 (+) Transcript_1831:485-1189(+)